MSMITGNTTSPIANPEVTQAILDKFNIYANRSLCQNFIINDEVIRKFCNLANVSDGDKIIEVGPGIGAITLGLLKKNTEVVAIEIDKNIARILQDNIKTFCKDKKSNIKIVNRDALEFDISSVVWSTSYSTDQSIKLISNLPYNAAKLILLTYFCNFANIGEATVMVQKEFAERMFAKPGEESYWPFAVKLTFFAEPCGSFNVCGDNFIPATVVDSTVIKIKRKQGVNIAVGRKACEVVDAAFENMYIPIEDSVKLFYKNAPLYAAKMLDAFSKNGLSLSEKAGSISPSQYLAVAKTLVGVA